MKETFVSMGYVMALMEHYYKMPKEKKAVIDSVMKKNTIENPNTLNAYLTSNYYLTKLISPPRVTLAFLSSLSSSGFVLYFNPGRNTCFTQG